MSKGNEVLPFWRDQKKHENIYNHCIGRLPVVYNRNDNLLQFYCLQRRKSLLQYVILVV